MHAPTDRVLLIAPSWVGDAILSEPLIAKLQRAGIERPVDVVVPPWCGPVYARMKGVGRVFDTPATHGEFALVARRRLGVSLREYDYTHAYVLPNTWKSALVPYFARISSRIGYIGEGRYGLLTEARKLDRKRLPQLVARYAALADAPGVGLTTLPAPRLVPDADNRRAAMLALGLSLERPVAILCPGAEFGPAKRWPAAHFAHLAQRLVGDGHAVWILGSPNDRPDAAALVSALPAGHAGIIDLTGRTDLGTAIDLMSVAALVVNAAPGVNTRFGTSTAGTPMGWATTIALWWRRCL